MFFTDSAPFRTRSLILSLPSPSNTWCYSRGTREHFVCKRNCQPLIWVSTHFIDFPSCVRAESVESCSGNHTAGHWISKTSSVLRIETLDNLLKVVNSIHWILLCRSYHVSISWSKVWLEDIVPMETLLVCWIWFCDNYENSTTYFPW